jgi:hypothetical protein
MKGDTNMIIRKTIGFYYSNTPIEDKIFEASTEIEVENLINEFILNNKNNIQGWNTNTKGIRSINTKIIK